MEEDLEDFLAHYGVKGMKWGVRKEEKRAERAQKREERAQKTKARREKRAGKVDVRIDAMRTRISELNAAEAKTKWNFRKASIARDRRDVQKNMNQAIKDAKAIRAGKFTDTEKKLLIGGAVLATAATAYGIHQGIESGDFRRLSEKGKAFLAGQDKVLFKEKAVLARKDLTDAQVEAIVVYPINPNYGDVGTKVNCRRATMAYEMRRRGYDVKATRTTTGSGQTALGMENVFRRGKPQIPTDPAKFVRGVATEDFKKQVFNSKDPTPLLDIQNRLAKNGSMGAERVWSRTQENTSGIISALQKQPNHARGELGMLWAMGGGHSMAWEIINGKPVIFDTQNGMTYRTPDQIAKLQDQLSEAAITRLDNAQLNEDFLLRWIKNV